MKAKDIGKPAEWSMGFVVNGISGILAIAAIAGLAYWFSTLSGKPAAGTPQAAVSAPR